MSRRRLGLQKEESKKERTNSSEELTCILNKFNKGDIISNFIETPPEKKNSSVTVTKQNIIKQAINFLTEKFSDLDELILFLHLKHFQTKTTKRQWTAFEIKEAKRFFQPNFTPDKVSHSLKHYFNKYGHSCRVFTEKKGNCIWMVLTIDDEQPRRPVFFVAHIKLSVVFFTTSTMKQQLLQIAQKVVRKTFRGSEIEQLSVINENAEYFQNLNIKILSTLQNYIRNPDARLIPKKSGKKNVNNSESENVNENTSFHSTRDEDFENNQRKRKHSLENNEGHPPPENNPLKYTIKYFPFEEKSSESISCVEFKGTYILNGLKKLIDSEIADDPLPNHLYKKSRTGQTEIEMSMS